LPTHVQEQTNATFDLEADDSIILTTYFSSKGLESKVAVLADVNEVAHMNFVTPIIRKKLLYVGLTRASGKLVIHSQNDGGAYYMNLNSLMEDLEGA
jgi:superfamily I DNA/RNA helicase